MYNVRLLCDVIYLKSDLSSLREFNFVMKMRLKILKLAVKFKLDHFPDRNVFHLIFFLNDDCIPARDMDDL